jgi:tRNA threonylcarbamoyladenosine biosynthesis protein TsaE
MPTILTRSEEETAAVARSLGRRLERGAVVLLVGELGAGKTAFVRGLASGLDADPGDVSSPTFTLVQEYRGGRMPLYHVDLYRLTAEEVDDLGLEELAEDGVLAVEWADRWPRDFPGAIVVRIDDRGNTDRAVTISGEGPERGSDGMSTAGARPPSSDS